MWNSLKSVFGVTFLDLVCFQTTLSMCMQSKVWMMDQKTEFGKSFLRLHVCRYKANDKDFIWLLLSLY